MSLLLLLTGGSLSLAADLRVGPTQSFPTIADAVDAAADGDRILVDPGVYPEPEMAVVAIALTIVPDAGPGTVSVELDAGRNLFVVEDGGALTLVDLDLNGRSDGRIAQVTGASLHVEGCTIRDTTTPINGQPGGTFSVTDAALSIAFSTLDAAIAPVKNGGHVHAVRSVVDVYGSTLTHGDANDGGAISAVDASTVIIEASRLSENTADDGGAVFVEDGDLALRSSTLQANVARAGTVHCLRGGTCAIEGSWFQGNVAATGALLTVSGTTATTLATSALCGTPSGDAPIDLASTTAALTTNVFTDNVLGAPLVRVAGSAVATLQNNHFVGAVATGAGAAVRVEGQASFVNNLVAYNTGGGPALEVAGGTLSEGYNLWFANTPSHASVALSPTNLVGVDPGFAPPVAGACDLAALIPPPGSPAVDAGDPSILDADGTVSDIGAFGDLPGAPAGGTDADLDGVFTPIDCDDADPSVFPGAPEVTCNGVDDDCDPSTADVPDADGDGFDACGADCDDTNPSVSPGATEVPCNGVDDDCDPGTVDGADLDGDGATDCVDCDDADPARSPAYAEVPCNGLDDDCDPGTSDADADADLDGVSVCGGDCDDNDAAVFPGAPEVPCNGVDDDCTPTTPDAGDADLDGFDLCDADCDDGNPTVYPGAAEVECNDLDDDCDPGTPDAVDADQDGVPRCEDCNDDNPDRSAWVTVWLDQDGDGWGVGQPSELCGQPLNAALQPGDCDDGDPWVNPGVSDTPYDGIDQDCDGADLDDLDADGWNRADDCDDADPTRYPDAEEVPGDGIDQDCTGNDATTTLVGGAGVDCGCRVGPVAAAWWAPLLALGLRRRR